MSWRTAISEAIAKKLPKKKVLSLSDGTSHGQEWLTKRGIPYDYYASEIDPKAIAYTQARFPKTKQLGDVRDIDLRLCDLNPDILTGGLPCVNFSSVGNRLGMRNLRTMEPITDLKTYLDMKNAGEPMTASSLAFEGKRLLDDAGDIPFMFENVASMSPYWRDILDNLYGVRSFEVGGAGPSARRRLLWTNATSPLEALEINKELLKNRKPVALENMPVNNLAPKNIKYRVNPDAIDLFTGKAFRDEPQLIIRSGKNWKTIDKKGYLPTMTTNAGIKVLHNGKVRDLTKDELVRFGNLDTPADATMTRLRKMVGNGWDNSIEPYYLNLFTER